MSKHFKTNVVQSSSDEGRGREQRFRYGDSVVAPSQVQVDARNNSVRDGHGLPVINLQQGEIPDAELVSRAASREQAES